jgi:SAM-dependent methyltransferase
MMDVEDIRDLIARLGTSANALLAVGLALQARLDRPPTDTVLTGRIADVLGVLGARDLIDGLSEADSATLLAGIRTDLFTAATALRGTSPVSGWTHVKADLLQSAGDVSAGFPRLLLTRIAPQLEGLADRLASPDAAFLDVGVGVAALSIAMVRQWPRLRVVGVDPWGPAITIGWRNVESAGLGGRIDLREAAAEDLSDTDAFDLAWIPSLFIPQRSIARIVERVARSLRPGGWLLFAALNPDGEPLAAALNRFRTTLWGGSVLDPDAVQALLTDNGLVDVRLLPGPPAATDAIAVGRR